MIKKCKDLSIQRIDSVKCEKIDCAFIGICELQEFTNMNINTSNINTKHPNKSELVEEANKLGLTNIVLKPLPIEELGGLIKTYLDLE